MPSRVTLRRKSRAAPEETPGEQETGGNHTLDANIGQAVAGHDVKAGEQTNAASSSSGGSRSNFVLVMDNGQLALMPAAKAHLYRSLPQKGDDDSGASTPAYRMKKKSKSHHPSSDGISPRITVRALKRGRGRPPKKRSTSRMLEFELEEEEEEAEESEGEGDAEEDEEEGEDEGTPADELVETVAEDDDDLVPPLSEEVIHLRGRAYILQNEELVLETDEDGEKKIDIKGNLLGDREYNFATFTSPYRSDKEKQYVLSIDAARGAGYRDSLLFFRRNPMLIKLSCTDKEKVMLIEQGRLSAQLRTRNVTMLAVRNLFKLFGARIVKGGISISDDYYEQEAKEAAKRDLEAAQEAEKEASAPPAARAIERRRDLDRDRDRQKRRPDAFTFSTSDMHGNAIYTTFGDTGQSPFERARGWNARRVNLQRADLDEENWMIEMARSVRGMNHEILVSRNERLKAFPRPFETIEESSQSQTLDKGGEENGVQKGKSESLPIGFYEPLTNVPHYSALTQSRSAHLERIHERPLIGKEDVGTGSAILGSAKVGSQGWGLASFDHVVTLPRPRVQGVTIAAAASAKEEQY